MKKSNLQRSMKAFVIMSALGLLTMTACGNDEHNESAGSSSEMAWVYVPEYLTIEDEEINYYNIEQAGDSLYYVSNHYDEEFGRTSQDLCKYSMVDGSLEKRSLNWAKEEKDGEQNRNWHMQLFTVAEDESLVANLYCSWMDEQGNYTDSQQLVKMDAEGNLIFTVDLNQMLEKDSEYRYIEGMVLDDKGRIYLYGRQEMWLYEADGTYKGDISTGGMGGWINAAGCGKDGRVYISGYGIGGMEGNVLAAVDFEAKKIGDTYKNFPDSNAQCIVPGFEQEFLVSDEDTLYEYDTDTQTKTALLHWLDCDVNGSYVQNYGSMKDGRIFAVINDWDSNDDSIAVITKKKSEDVVQKETIVLGSLYANSDIKAAAVKFNKSNEKYRISIRNYIDYDSNGENAYKDGYNRFLSDIASDKCPDIVDLSGANLEQLTAKGVFEDLNAYLEKSSVLKKDDFLESVIKGYTFDGKLVGIPSAFDLSTIVGATEKLGNKKQWTIQEMIEFADKYPEAKLFDNYPKSGILEVLLRFNEKVFIDWSTGECKFNNEEFKNLLLFANRFPDQFNYSEGEASTPTKIQNGEVLLDMMNINSWESIQIYWEMFGGDVTCIGYPTVEGVSGTAMMGSQVYAIATKSQKKDGAWAFVEGFLARDIDDFWYGFPTRKDLLKTMMEEAMKVEYVLDENGNPMLDENGEPITYGSGGGVGYQDGWEYTFTTPTQKEVDMIRSLMEDATVITYSVDEWTEIVREEAAAFFAGQKSVDEVTNIIQSRIKIYVDENR